MSFRRSFVAFTAFLSTASAVVLKDLPHSDGPRFQRRGDPLECLDLRSAETFIWGGSDDSQVVLGNLTVYMPDEQENIVSMDRFKGMLTSVNCTKSTIDLAFKDDDTFAYAKNTWDWVNGADNHSFVMVAGTGDCGWNDHRQPFTVSTLEYDEVANVAHLKAVAQDWKEAIHTYDLHVGGIPQASLPKRSFGEVDFNKDLSLDFNHELPIDSITVPAGDGLFITLNVANCSTSGQFAFEFTLETILLIPKKAEMNVHPIGVSANIVPKLTLSGALSSSKTFGVDILKIPLDAITIPGGILDLGPEIIFSAGVTVGPIKGSASISTGAIFRLDDAAHATVDILGGDSDQSGWTPTIETVPVTLDAQLSGGVKAFIKAEVALVATAFGEGFSVGLAISPYIRADLSTITSSSAACGPADPSGSFEAIQLAPSVGIELDFDVTTPGHGSNNPLVNIIIGALETPLPGLCLPFGSGNVSADSTANATLISSSSVVPALLASSSAALSSLAPVTVSSPSYVSVANSSSPTGNYASRTLVASSLPAVATVTSSKAGGYVSYGSWGPEPSLSTLAAPISPSSSSIPGVYSWTSIGSSSSTTVSSSSSSKDGYAWAPYAAAVDPTTLPVYASSTLSTVTIPASSSSVLVVHDAPAASSGYHGYGSGR